MPYPYIVQGRVIGQDNLTPQVPCVFVGKRGSSPTILVEVDTGAAISIAPKGLARDIGAELSSGRAVSLLGVGGRTRAFVHVLDLRIEGNTYPSVPVAITVDDSAPFLLGRLGFLTQAALLFDPVTRTVTVAAVPRQTPISTM